MPADWIKRVIIRIPKKGALSDCNNWHSIALLSVPSKILAKIIIRRISDAIEGFLKVNKMDVQLPLPFSALLSDVA